MFEALRTVPNILLLLSDESTLHNMLTGLAGSRLLMINGILFTELQRETLSTPGAFPADRHLLREESFTHTHIERCPTFGADPVLEIVRGIVEEAGHPANSIL